MQEGMITHHGGGERDDGKGDRIEQVFRVLGEGHLLVVGEILLGDDRRDDGVAVRASTLRANVNDIIGQLCDSSP